MKSKVITTRLLAMKILVRVLGDGAYPDLAIDAGFAAAPGLDARDRAFAGAIVMGVLRHKATLEHELSQIVGKWPRKREVATVLLVGAYQLEHMDGVEDFAAINETVEVARGLYGKRVAGFVNSTLRRFSETRGKFCFPDMGQDPVRAIALEHSYETWMVERWVDSYGVEHAAALAEALNTRPPLALRVNTNKTTREALMASFAQSGIEARPGDLAPESVILPKGADIGGLTQHHAGLFTVQDEAAQLCSIVLAPRPGEDVLDVCSAPGGKATHIAELMQNTGRVLATDRSAARLGLVREHVARLGADIVETRRADAEDPGYAREVGGPFDRVLVDAPCSGLGTIRRNPDIKWTRTPGDIPRLARAQLGILEMASAVLKHAGTLVYSVCTLMPEECEDVCRAFLEKHPDFVLDADPTAHCGDIPGLTADHGFLILDPVRHNTDGFFIARFTRREK